MSSQHVDVVVTPVLHGRAVVDATPVTMVEAQFATHMRNTFEKSHLCAICTFSFPESEMVQVDGAWYCTRYKHDQEADTTSGIQRGGR